MFAFRIDGGPQLARVLSELAPNKQRGVLAKMLVRAGEPIRQRAAELAPVEAGKPDLADHIAIAPTMKVSGANTLGSRSREEGEAAVAIGPEPNFFYGLFQEYGAVHAGSDTPISFTPFLRPALDERAEAAIKLFQEDIWAHLRAQTNRSGPSRGGL